MSRSRSVPAAHSRWWVEARRPGSAQSLILTAIVLVVSFTLALGVAQAANASHAWQVILACCAAAVSLIAQFILQAGLERRRGAHERQQAWHQAVDPWPWPPDPRPDTGRRLVRADALDARNGIARFRLRDNELKALRTWCADPPAPPLRIVSGPPGVGKTRLATRLAMELCEEETPWVAGAALPGAAADAVRAANELDAPALVVVDQADLRTDLAPLFPILREGRVRVLLLARSGTDGQWWQQLRRAVTAQQQARWLPNVEEMQLAAIIGDLRSQRQLFERAAQEFARHFDIRLPRSPQLGAVAEDATLATLHAAALVAVLRTQQDNRATLVDTDERVWQELIDREAHLWRGAADAAGLDLLPDTQRQVMACVALLGAANESDAIELMRLVPDLQDAGRERLHAVAAWVHALYPGETPQWFAAFEPQQLATGLLVSELARDDAFADQLLTDVPEARLQRVLAVLATAAPHLPWAADRIERILHRQPDTALPAGVRVSSWTLSLDANLATCVDDPGFRVSGPALDMVWAALPTSGSTMTLRRTIVAVARRRAAQPGLDTIDDAVRRRELADALWLVGDFDAAEPYARQACDMLAAAGDSVSHRRVEYARALLRLADVLRLRGHHDEAVETAERALAAWDEVKETERTAGLRGYANALKAMSGATRAAGKPEQAAMYARRSLVCWQELYQPSAMHESAGYATAMASLSRALHEAGFTGEAVETGREAARLWRHLVQSDRDSHQRMFADVLAGLALVLGESGDFDESAAVAQEAVELNHELVQVDPEANVRWYADALIGLCQSLRDKGQRQDAETAGRQAVGIYRRLMQRDRDQYVRWYANALRCLAMVVAEGDEAVQIGQDAVDLFRDIAREDPAANRRLYVQAMTNLGSALRDAGRLHEAVTVGQEAVQLWPELVEVAPETNQRWYGHALLLLSSTHLALGQLPLARETAIRAVDQFAAQAALAPHKAHSKDLAMAQRYAFKLGAIGTVPGQPA